MFYFLPFSNFPIYCTGLSIGTTHDGFDVGLIRHPINDIASTPSFVNNFRGVPMHFLFVSLGGNNMGAVPIRRAQGATCYGGLATCPHGKL